MFKKKLGYFFVKVIFIAISEIKIESLIDEDDEQVIQL